MFRLGKTYQTGSGHTARIISVDSGICYGTTKVPCPVVAEITASGGNYPTVLYFYDADGNYCGLKSPDYSKHRLISDEPTTEEAKLIEDIRVILADGAEDDVALVKVLRQLRAK